MELFGTAEHFMTQEQLDKIRPEFESYITEDERLRKTTPLGAVMINDAFHHYMDADTDTYWLGFIAGYLVRTGRPTFRKKLLAVLTERTKQLSYTL